MDCKIVIDKTLRWISYTSTKEIYWHLLDQIANRPASEAKWREKTDLENRSDKFLTRDTSVQNLPVQFQITHRLLACGYNHKIRKINTNGIWEKCDKHTVYP
jgi:hypothetical protein